MRQKLVHFFVIPYIGARCLTRSHNSAIVCPKGTVPFACSLVSGEVRLPSVVTAAPVVSLTGPQLCVWPLHETLCLNQLA